MESTTHFNSTLNKSHNKKTVIQTVDKVPDSRPGFSTFMWSGGSMKIFLIPDPISMNKLRKNIHYLAIESL